MNRKSKAKPLRALIAQPRTFVSRLILADLIAKRGDGPLERKRMVYRAKRR